MSKTYYAKHSEWLHPIDYSTILPESISWGCKYLQSIFSLKGSDWWLVKCHGWEVACDGLERVYSWPVQRLHGYLLKIDWKLITYVCWICSNWLVISYRPVPNHCFYGLQKILTIKKKNCTGYYNVNNCHLMIWRHFIFQSERCSYIQYDVMSQWSPLPSPDHPSVSSPGLRAIV